MPFGYCTIQKLSYLTRRLTAGRSRENPFALLAQPAAIFFSSNVIEPDQNLVIHAHSNSVPSSGKAKANVVVAIGRIVVIAVSRTAIPAVVDPRAAAQHAVGALLILTRRYFYTTGAGCRCKLFCRQPRLSVPSVIACTAAYAVCSCVADMSPRKNCASQ